MREKSSHYSQKTRQFQVAGLMQKHNFFTVAEAIVKFSSFSSLLHDTEPNLNQRNYDLQS